MIPLLWVAGAALVGVVGGVAIAAYWKEIIGWIEKVYAKLPSNIQQDLQGAMAFIRKLDDIFTNIMKYYSYSEQTQEWTETTVSQTVDPSKVPDSIKQKMKARQAEVDLTYSDGVVSGSGDYVQYSYNDNNYVVTRGNDYVNVNISSGVS